MKKSNIYLLIYDGYLFIKHKDNIEKIKADETLFYDGRLNSFNKLLKCLKESKIITRSSFKLVYDNINVIYFGNYTDFELKTITECFVENGYQNIKLINFASLLDTDNYSYIFYNNDVYYGIFNHNKYVVFPSMNECLIALADSETITDKNILELINEKLKNQHIYAVDDVVNYLFNLVC